MTLCGRLMLTMIRREVTTMALQRIWIPSPSYHSRNINGVRLIVLHTAEGARTIESLGSFFQNGANQVSSHVGADDKLGKVGEYVKRGNAAWTQANYNNVAISLELCGFASWSTTTWKNDHHNMLQNCADWIAEEAKYFGLPITKLNDSQAQGSGRGVCQHKNLGAGGGGHVDCGSGFPMDYVLDLARGQEPPPPKPEELEDMFYLQFVSGKARMVIPVQYLKGKSKLCLASPVSAQVRLQFSEGKDVTRDLGGGASQNTDIPNGGSGGMTVLVTLNSGNGSAISCTYSDRT